MSHRGSLHPCMPKFFSGRACICFGTWYSGGARWNVAWWNLGPLLLAESYYDLLNEEEQV